MHLQEYHDVKPTPSPTPSTTTGVTLNDKHVTEKPGASSQGKINKVTFILGSVLVDAHIMVI